MYGMHYIQDYIDYDIMERCKKNFLRVYPEFKPIIVGLSADRTGVIIECEFPEGTFYFKVSTDVVSQSFDTIDDAEKSSLGTKEYLGTY